MIAQVTPVLLDRHPVQLCRLSYPGHSKGCPNVRRCATVARPLRELAGPPFLAVWVDFDLAAHVERMREKHPQWSDRQLRNCLYWQGGVRKRLRDACRALVRPGVFLTYCPEIHGVDVTATLETIGVHLEWPPVHWTRCVALAGVRLRF